MLGEIFGLFGVTDFDVARRMTLAEYRLRWRGYLLAFLDKEYFTHLEAFVSFQVQATDKQGKLVYEKMSDFYDKEKRKREVLGYRSHSPKNSRLMQITRNLADYRKMKGGKDVELFG